MKKKWITMLGALLIGIGFLSAQYCPPTGSSNYRWRGSAINNNSAYIALDNFSFSFTNAIEEGVRTGRLTQHEIFVLENAYDRFARRVRRAYLDGRMTSSEWSMIEFSMRNLDSDLRREWNDDQVRLG